MGKVELREIDRGNEWKEECEKKTAKTHTDTCMQRSKREIERVIKLS